MTKFFLTGLVVLPGITTLIGDVVDAHMNNPAISARFFALQRAAGKISSN